VKYIVLSKLSVWYWWMVRVVDELGCNLFVGIDGGGFVHRYEVELGDDMGLTEFVNHSKFWMLLGLVDGSYGYGRLIVL
jgi:hypothetical protein